MRVRLICIVFTILLGSNHINIDAQSAIFTKFLNDIPGISYGELPYWHGTLENYHCFEHGFYFSDSINSTFNTIINLSYKDNQGCFIIEKNIKHEIHKEDLLYPSKDACVKTSYKTKDNSMIEEIFCPVIYAAAKSVINDKFYIIYFWEASFTETIRYFALVFDLHGILKSYLCFDDWQVGFPLYPFRSSSNKIRIIDTPKSIATYLPNKLIYVKEPFSLEGGGNSYIYKLNDDGRFELCKSWKEKGEIDISMTGKDKYTNLVRVDEENNETTCLSIFAVQDADGYSNIRMKDNTSSAIIRRIFNNDIVVGTYLKNGWVKVEFLADSNGSVQEGGYIHSSRLKRLSDDSCDFLILPSEAEWKIRIGAK